MLRIHFVFLMMMFWQYTMDAQCYTTVGSPIVFTSNGQNASAEYTTRYALTDYNGVILQVSNTTLFTALNTPGAYKIYGINYRTSAGISQLNVGNNIDQLASSCLDVGDAFSILVCQPTGSGCNTFNGTYSFKSTGGNTSLTTRYVLTDTQWNILQISGSPSFSGLSNGQFLIFPVNYQTISGLNTGSDFRNITGTCYDVGNPLLIKSCAPCTISAGNDVELCSPTPITLTANAGISGTYAWSTGQSGASINVNPSSSQTYKVTFTSAEGCVATDDVTVNIIGRPTAEAGLNVTICNGQQTTLSAQAVAGAIYTWSNGANTRQITVSPVATQTYIVTVSVGNCESMDFVTVFVNENPNAVITGNNVICSGTGTTLTASGGSSYVWSTGGNTANINVNPSGNTTYTVTVTNANGCTAVTSATVTVNTLPTAAITGNNVICSGKETTLTASGGSSYVWSTGGNTAANTVNPTVNTTYTVSVTNVNGCTAVTSSTVTVNTLPTAAITGNNVICSGTGTILTATGGSSYVWSTGGNTANINVSPSGNTTYTVTVTNVNGCTAVTSATVTVNTLPTAAITGNNVICSGTGTTLTASGGSSYVWSTGGNTAAITVNPTVNTTYTVTVTNVNGCTAVARSTVTVNPTTNAAITGNNVICSGASTTLFASGGSSYAWNNGGNTSSINVNPNVNTTYTVTVTNASGCTAVASSTVTVNPTPNAAITGNNVICSGASTTLFASGGSSYVWSNGGNTSSINVNPAVNTAYTVTVTNASGCTAVASSTVTVNICNLCDLYACNIPCNECSGTITFNSTGQNQALTTTYVLTNSLSIIQSISNTNSFSNVGEGTWFIFGINYDASKANSGIVVGGNVFSISGACVDVGEPYVAKVCGPPTAVITGNTVICSGASTTLFASGGSSYAWNNGGNTSSINVNPNVNTTYTVTVTNGSGCTAVASSTVTVNPTPNAAITGNKVICSGASTVLTASGGGFYNWSTGGTTSVINVNPSVNTTYTVTITNGSGCTAIASSTVTVNPTPNAAITGSTVICSGASTTLFASGGSSYAWSNGGNTSSINVNPSVNTTYTVTVTNVNGCTSVASSTVTVNPAPNAAITGNNVICSGASTVLTASGGGIYNWSTGGTTSVINVNPSVNTTYTVTVTNASGCTAVTSSTVTVNACGKLGDFVWEDLNGNGIQDGGEPGISGVNILLFKDGVQVATTSTDLNGMYMFTNLAPGNYTLLFPNLAGYTRTVTGRGTTDTDSNVNPTTGLLSITLSGSDTNVTLDAGYVRTASLGNFVWEDSNRNGVQDSGEIGIPNVVVNLTGTDGAGRTVNLSTQTDGNGLYQFNNLWPGAYTVTFLRPNEDFKSSNKDSVADDARDSDASGSTGQTDVIVLNSGQNNQTIDAGFYRCARVGDYVWLDSGSNPNVQDQNDEGLDGIVVQLFSTTNPTVAVQTVVTFTNQGRKGYYQFEVCNEGQYFIKVFKPEEYNFVDTRSGNGTNDSKVVDINNGTTNVFTINYGANIDTMDIGLKFKPLPVSLLEFTGYWDKEEDVNVLQWTTVTEINNDYFDVERSFGGEPFRSIGVVKGQGNSISKQEYDFIDEDIALNGIYSYRLRQVDFDGSESYSNIVHIRVDRYKEPTITLYPNPAVTSSTLEVTGNENASYGLSIFDAAGKLVYKVDDSVHLGTWKYQLDASNLPRGVYHLMVNVNGEIKPMKWIVIE